MSFHSVKNGLRALIVGPPGAGKGTLTRKLLADFPSIRAVSSGDVLRDNISQRTEVGSIAQEYIAKGQLVPDSIMLRLLGDVARAEHFDRPGARFLLDGFPRTMDQALKLDDLLTEHRSPLNCVLWLNVPLKELVGRITQRWIHPGSGRVYNLSYNPPQVQGRDDVTGEPLVARVDDTTALFEKRYESFIKQTMPLVNHYRSAGILHEFSGTSSDIIYPDLKKAVSDVISPNTNPQPPVCSESEYHERWNAEWSHAY